jgi:hypothetical protein
MLVGCTDNITFLAVLGECFTVMRFIMDKCLHANGYKWMSVVIMMTVEMCMGGDVRVHIGLRQETELMFYLWQ